MDVDDEEGEKENDVLRRSSNVDNTAMPEGQPPPVSYNDENNGLCPPLKCSWNFELDF